MFQQEADVMCTELLDIDWLIDSLLESSDVFCAVLSGTELAAETANASQVWCYFVSSFQVANHGFALKFLSVPPELPSLHNTDGPEVLVAPNKVAGQNVKISCLYPDCHAY